MKYARAAWNQERASWRAVVQLNVLRSIIAIVEMLQAEMDDEHIPSRPLSPADMSTGALLRLSLDTTSSEVETASHPPPVPLTNKHHILKLRLGPLRRVEADLRRQLGMADAEELAGPDYGVSGEVVDDGPSVASLVRKRTKEFGVTGWKDALGGWMKNPKEVGDGQNLSIDNATEVIASCREDMKALWMDDAVRGILAKRKMRIQDSAGLSVCDLFCSSLSP
jgi:guanine nucleotide-binding protein subunit alpha